MDVYRGLVVLMMFVVHTRRLQATGRWEGATAGAEAVLQGFMWSEPFIAASFLFIVGVSLVMSRERAPNGSQWFAKHIQRAAGLYVLAVGLFVPHYGLALPDLVASPGILSAIAWAVVVVSASLVAPWPRVVTLGVVLLVLGATGWLEWTQVSVSGLNAGPGGALPLLAFAAFGAWLALQYRATSRRTLGLAPLVALVPLATVWWLGAEWTQLHPSLHPSYRGEVAFFGIFTPPTETVRLLFWNHTVAGTLGLLLPITATLWALLVVERHLDRYPGPWLALLGRHALVAYVGHLIVLGLLEVAGITPRNPWHTGMLVLGLGAAAIGIAATLEARKRVSHVRA